MFQKVNAWIVLAFLGLATHELIDVLIRPKYGMGDSWITFLLGIAPNFLAAGLIFPYSILTIRDTYVDARQKRDTQNLKTWFWTGLFTSQIGLLSWELIQKTGGNLVFDVYDILATLMGGLLAIFLFYTLKK